MKRVSRYMVVLLSALTLLLSACGGGGGGGGSQGGSSRSSASVSGSSVKKAASGSVGSAATGSYIGNNVSVANSVTITITSYDSSNNLIDTKETISGDTGAFGSNIEIDNNGGYLVVKAVKSGFATYEKTITFASATDLSGGVDFLAELDPVLTSVITVANSVSWNKVRTASGVTQNVEMLSFGVVQRADGSRTIMDGNSMQSASASDTVIWAMDLPAASLRKQSITSLKVAVNNYDPSNSDDMRMFPSENDSNGDKLVSVGFDYVDITDQNGNAVKFNKTTGDVSAAAALDYRVRRKLPNCDMVKVDEDTTKPGAQVGFYFNRGSWKKIGSATLYNSPGTADTDLMIGISNCNPLDPPYAVVTTADLDLDYQNNWWNFDYVEVGNFDPNCVSGLANFVSPDGSQRPAKGLPLSLSGFKEGVSELNGFMGSEDVVKTDGSYKLNFSVPTGTAITTPSGMISYKDPFTNWWKSDYYTLPSVANATTQCYDLKLEIPNPYACKVSGKLYRNSASTPFAYNYVFISQVDQGEVGNINGQRMVSTDDQGAYSAIVMCDTKYILDADALKQAFIVNGALNNSGSITYLGQNVLLKEQTDASDAVVMQNGIIPNRKPFLYGYSELTSLVAGESTRMYGYAWDPDGDSVTTAWSDNCGGTFVTDQYSFNPRWDTPVTAPANPSCTLTFEATDSYGLKATQTFTVSVVSGNAPPIISSLIVPDNVKQGNTVRLIAYAFDRNVGDTLTYAWSQGNWQSAGGSCGGVFNAPTAYRTNYTPNVSGITGLSDVCPITITVNDSNNSVNNSVTATANLLVFKDRPAVISSLNIPANVPKNKQIPLVPSVYDPDGETIPTFLWSSSSCAGGGTISPSAAQNTTFTAPNQKTPCTLTLQVTDAGGNNISKSETFNVTNRAPVKSVTTVPSTYVFGKQVALSSTYVDPENDPITYTWAFHNGTAYQTIGIGSSVNWTPVTAGTYNVRLQVRDPEDLSPAEIFSVTVAANRPPTGTIKLPPGNVSVGSQAALNVSVPQDADGHTITYKWYIDNVLIGTTQAMNYTVTQVKAYAAKVELFDGYATTTLTGTINSVNTVPTGTLTIPGTSSVGKSVTVSVSTPFDADGHTITYQWYIDNVLVGGATGVSYTFTPAQVRAYPVKVELFDGYATTTKTGTLNSTNSAPTGTLAITGGGYVNTTHSINVTNLSDADGHTMTKKVYIDGALVNTTIPHTWMPTVIKSYTISVIADDGYAPTTFANLNFVVLDAPQTPVVTSITPSATISRNTLKALTATAVDGNGDPITFTWKANNVSIGTGASINWTPTVAGVYTVVVTATTANDGAFNTMSTTMTVVNNAPTINTFNVQTTGTKNQTFTLSATASDLNGDTLTYQWTADGAVIGAALPSTTWTPTVAKSYNVVLTVTAVDGTATQSATATVINAIPTINTFVIPPTVNKNQVVNFVSTASNADNDPLTYTWKVDGVTLTGKTTPSITHTFTQSGGAIANVVLIVSDNNPTPGTVQDSRLVTVMDNQPVVTWNVPSLPVLTAGTVNLNATGTTDADGDTLTYVWKKDGVQVSTAQSFNLTLANGTYAIVLEVSDGYYTVTQSSTISVGSGTIITAE